MGRVLVPRGATSSLLASAAAPRRPFAAAAAAAAARQQVRHATEVVRPRRPYHFTQLVQLSDGSTYTVRTTSPAALYRSTKDSRNHVLWQPSERSLRNVEVDEAGKLAAFRERFGRSWDVAQEQEEEAAAGLAPAAAGEKEKQPAAAAAAAPAAAVDDAAAGGKTGKGAQKAAAAAPAPEPAEDPYDALSDLISGYAAALEPTKAGGLSAKDQARKDKSGKKK